MKKLILCIAVALTVLSCNNLKKEKIAEEATIAENDSTPKNKENRLPCGDPLNVIIQRHASEWCNEDMFDDHSIGALDFKKYHDKKWGTNNKIEYKPISWNELKLLIGGNKCYEKYIQFSYPANPKDNSGIEVKIVDCFTVSPPCYSIPFINKIVEKNNVQITDNFYFTIGEINNKETILFQVKDPSTMGYSAFNVSHWPKKMSDKAIEIDNKGRDK